MTPAPGRRRRSWGAWLVTALLAFFSPHFTIVGLAGAALARWRERRRGMPRSARAVRRGAITGVVLVAGGSLAALAVLPWATAHVPYVPVLTPLLAFGFACAVWIVSRVRGPMPAITVFFLALWAMLGAWAAIRIACPREGRSCGVAPRNTDAEGDRTASRTPAAPEAAPTNPPSTPYARP